MKRTPESRKQILWLIISLALAVVLIVGGLFLLQANGEAPNSTNLENANEDSSQILLTGSDYSLEKEQEEQYLEEQQEKQSEPEQEQEPGNLADSIMQPETVQPETPETPAPETPSQNIPVPGPEEPSQPSGGGGQSGGGGSGGGGSEPKEPETETKQDVSKMPYVDISGEAVQGSNVYFQVRGRDYNLQILSLDSSVLTVTFNGILVYSTEVSEDGWVTYRVENQLPGEYVVQASVTDKEGNTAQTSMTITVQEEEPQQPEEYVTLYVEADSIGRGTILYETGLIQANESAANFVRRMLENSGLTPAIDDSSYLSRIWGVFPPDPAVVPEPLQKYVTEQIGELGSSPGDGSLGERDYSPNSGWVYLYNGWYQGVGLYGVTLHDGDEIHLGFSLWGGAEYNGEWPR